MSRKPLTFIELISGACHTATQEQLEIARQLVETALRHKYGVGKRVRKKIKPDTAAWRAPE